MMTQTRLTQDSPGLDDLAQLAGYTPSTQSESQAPPASANGHAPQSEATANEESLLDPEDFQDEETETPIWSHPLAKIGFVGGLGLAGVAIIALFWNSVQSAGNRASGPKIELPADSTQDELIEDPMSAALRRRQEEVGDLKTSNALGNQAQAMALQEGNQNFSGTPTLATPPERPEPQTTPQVVAQPVRPTPAPVASAPRPAPTPAPQPAAAAQPAPEPEQIDPQEQWQSLTQLGSYGLMSFPDRGGFVVAAAPETPSPQAQPAAQTAPPVPQALFVSQVTSQAQGSDPLTNFRYQADEAAILGVPPIRFAVINPGSRAAAKLTTPIFWAQDLENDAQPQRVGLELSEPLLGFDGGEALPVGSQMVAQVDVISSSGLVQLSITAVVIPKAGGFEEIPLPANAFIIEGGDGNPLLASERTGNSSEIRGAEIQLGVIGALGNVGELLNRPDSSTTITTATSSVSAVDNGSVNVVAGLAEGVSDAILDSRQDRLEDQIDRITDRSRIWYVGEGTELQIFVNSQVSFQTGGS